MLFLEPDDLSGVGVSFEDAHEIRVMKRSDLFDSYKRNILNKM